MRSIFSAAPFFRINLRRLILLLALLSAMTFQSNTFYASYGVQHQLLIDNTLESNRVYSKKLADSIDDFLKSAQQQLAYSAIDLAKNFTNPTALIMEANRLRLQTDSFNSVVFVDMNGKVLAASPETLNIFGKIIESPGARESIQKRLPLISSPYISAAGNLLVFISTPVIDNKGQYLGYIGGTIYLKQKNILNNLLGEHYYRDGSYLYVVDHNRHLLYHPDPERVGKNVINNLAIDAITRGESGRMRLINSTGIDMLAGYAIVSSTGWGVVTQRPTQATLAPLNGLMINVLLNTLPLTSLILLLIWWFTKKITLPLRELADSAQHMDRPTTADRIQKIRSWYFESNEIKRALLSSFKRVHYKINKLLLDVKSDPLTGLHNRRGLDMALDIMQSENENFAIVSLDIDHFKSVNDTYGHDAGDKVLSNLADKLKMLSRDDDIVCRVGGEEFLILLPSLSSKPAEEFAKRLRKEVELMKFQIVGHITISLGVACWNRDTGDINGVLKIADEMLYKAKHNGRNRVEV
ncbi:sensor domain-containing diguanylate cyclase [Pseudomonas fluorescens]|uniref:sensor domain-containing diguanylate cyclase n=1 Tax=Pseudomonas fluorescens TaxID=294 RepID=UPI0030D9F37E